MNIVLIGMRGSGKTTIAKLLAERLNKTFYDLDSILAEEEGMPISEVVKQHGWEHFRDKESEITEEISQKTNAVISTGGGVILRKKNVDALKKNGKFIFLKTSLETMLERIKNANDRPPLTNKETLDEELKQVWEERKSLYEQKADITIETDNKTPEETSDEVISLLRKKTKRWNEQLNAKFMKITAKTKICMVIGDPVEHSLSPQMHNAGLQTLGVDDKYVFVGCHVKIENIEDFIKGVRAMNIHFIGCTMPHKIAVMQYVDEIDEVAKKIGAVNAIINDNNVLKASNTDWLGVVTPLEKITKLKNKTVALLGAGGAARAAAYGVTKKGAKLQIYNRTLEKAEKLAKEFRGTSFSFEKLENVKKADIIINTTSVGMRPKEDETPLPKEFLTNRHIVLDAVYMPYETLLLKEAKEKGATIIHGIEMFLAQAAAQLPMYTGMDAPLDSMRKVLLENIT